MSSLHWVVRWRFRLTPYAIRHTPGLGLLETIIAIGVITTGLFAVFTLVLGNARVAEEARLRFGAVQTAREGVEVVRMIRDANWLAAQRMQASYGDINGSTAFVYDAIAVFDGAAGVWSLTFDTVSLDDARARIVPQVFPSGTFWTQGDATDEPGDQATPYRRVLTVAPMCANRAVLGNGQSCDPATSGARIGSRVTSRVRWTVGGSTRDVVAEEDLYDWR